MQLLDSPPFFSDKVSSADPDYDYAALEGMLREAHRVHSHQSQREGFSVGQSSSVSERTGRLVGPLVQWLNVAKAQMGTLLDRQEEQILDACQADVEKHDPSKKNFTALGLKNLLQRRDQQLLHEKLLEQNSEIRGAHSKSLNEMEDFMKFQSFQLRHCCKTNGRGSDTILDFRQDTGIPVQRLSIPPGTG